MSQTGDQPCPPDHTEYLSEYVATNARTLHSFIHPECPQMAVFSCGDHWHIGHPTRRVKDQCLSRGGLNIERYSRP